MRNLLHFNLVFLIVMTLFSTINVNASTVNSLQLIDPTRPKLSGNTTGSISGKSETNKNSELRLQSLIFKNGRYKAIISGKLYKAGEKVGEYNIAKITAKKVYLSRGSEQRILELYSYEIKR
ncbi:hypothetical protein KO527_09125 [Pseudoalteromonas sp. C2R02]|uniref:hypothetical protein n=1 Tax=Pseudoalteromonas sp. C2R02 TaxID=2841565 RepID=UPI001C0A3A96|nr:hypothetical protein [Pseudoalteromonas sp. C2R02]MBU2969504.1 hypothetical protein [Pseudoalteromonas sp. C2R02]